MSAELQIESATVAAVAFRAVKQGLRTACLPVLPGFSIDHLEPSPGSATVMPAPGAVDVRIMVDVFVVTDAALAAAPNATPAGVASSVGQIGIILRLQMGANKDTLPTLLQLAPQPPDLGGLAAALGAAAAQAAKDLQALLPIASIDLAPQLTPFGITHPTVSDVVLEGGIVAIRFDPAQALQSHLFPGQDWGFFFDAAAVAELVIGRVRPEITKTTPGATVSASYVADGDIPHVDLAIDSSTKVLGFDDTFTVHFPSDLSVVAGIAPVLRASVAWYVDVHGIDPFKAVRTGVEHRVIDAINDFGGVQSGDRFFVLDTALPALTLLGSAFRFDSAHGAQDGMTVGGAVGIPGLLETPFSFSVSSLGKPARIQLCSQNARAGTGAPSHTPPSLFNTTCFAAIDVSGYGAICAATVRTPDASFQADISVPPAAPETGVVTLHVAVPALIASEMTQPLTFVLRTPRGVRLIDLGTAPKARADANGTLQNVLDIYIPDCLYFTNGRAGLAWGLDLAALKPHPSDGPDWEGYLQAQGGLIVQLVSLAGLEGGETLRFQSATHAIDVIADAQGRARVPVFLAPSQAPGPARLARANGQDFGGTVGVQSALFEYHATLRGALHGTPLPTLSGGVRVTTLHGHRLSTYMVRPYGVTIEQPARAPREDLNPQPLPPQEDSAPVIERLARGGIKAIEGLTALPGFPDSGLVFAQTADRGTLILDLGSQGEPRIAGFFSGPIGTIHLATGWAVAATGHDTAVFQYTPAPDEMCCHKT